MSSDDQLSTAARALASNLEPVAGQVYFSPECHANYAALGFSPSPAMANGVALPDGPAYFTSRGSVMGQVPGEVVAAAFGVFNPEAVVPAVAHGWSLTDAATICQARDDGAIGQLRRILGESPDGLERVRELLGRAVDTLRPEGRPLYAGQRSLPTPDTTLGATWRLADMLREYRGDSHTIAYTSAGFDATEIGLVSEQWWGLPPRSYSRTRAWSEAQFDAACDRLRSRGIFDADGALTDHGRDVREQVEQVTDGQMAAPIGALRDDAAELFALLAPWGAAIRDAHGYLVSGPHDLASASSTV
jgi:Helix-turn-helix family